MKTSRTSGSGLMKNPGEGIKVCWGVGGGILVKGPCLLEHPSRPTPGLSEQMAVAVPSEPSCPTQGCIPFHTHPGN